MSTITLFEEIQAWQKARELTCLVNKLSSQGAFSKDFGLRDQIRCAVVSVMSNNAEGFENQLRHSSLDILDWRKARPGRYAARRTRPLISSTSLRRNSKSCLTRRIKMQGNWRALSHISNRAPRRSMCVKIQQFTRSNVYIPKRVNMPTFKLANLTHGDKKKTK